MKTSAQTRTSGVLYAGLGIQKFEETSHERKITVFKTKTGKIGLVVYAWPLF